MPMIGGLTTRRGRGAARLGPASVPTLRVEWGGKLVNAPYDCPAPARVRMLSPRRQHTRSRAGVSDPVEPPSDGAHAACPIGSGPLPPWSLGGVARVSLHTGDKHQSEAATTG